VQDDTPEQLGYNPSPFAKQTAEGASLKLGFKTKYKTISWRLVTSAAATPAVPLPT
jgi:hypothetical protein